MWVGSVSGYWNDSLNWIQINTTGGQTQVHKVPTKDDDIVFSQAMSGLSTVGVNVNDSLTYWEVHPIEVGSNDTTGPRCRSMHISSTDLNLGPGGVDMGISIDVYTTNGGHIIIDSGSTVKYGILQLHGGDSSVTDLTIENSNVGELFSHAVWSSIYVDPLARTRLTGSTLGVWNLTSSSGGNIYAKDCAINSPNVHLGDNSIDTFLNCKIYVDGNAFVGLTFFIGKNAQFVSSNVNVEAFNQIYFTTSGSTLNGNVKCDYAGGYFVFDQEDPLHPLPNIINGNLYVSENNEFPIKGDVKISGNFINNSSPQDYYIDSTTIKINNEDIFTIGGLPNYGNTDSIIGCAQNYCHFSIEFFGDSSCNVFWPIGFPIDTLIINKSGCAKVTFTNSIYVSGQARIQSGQLALDPNDTIPYKMVCKGDLDIAQGGGIFLRKGSGGKIANIAIGGSLYDYNTQSDTSCAGFSNPYNGIVALYIPASHRGNNTISIADNSGIGNFNLIGQAGSDFTLTSDLSVSKFTFTNPGKLFLGDHHLIVSGDISGYGSNNYFVTNGKGSLQVNHIGNMATIFPVGPNALAYNPATIANNGTPDNFSVSVRPHVLPGGTNGSAYTAGVVDRTWNIEEAVPGAANATVMLQWNTADELSGFPGNMAFLSHYTSGSWNTGTQMAAVGSGPFTLTRSGITGFSPFAIMGPAGALPVTLIDFYGKYINKTIALTWHTTNELNTRYFTVEKGDGHLTFTSIANISASGGSQVAGYHYVDTGTLAQANYYRLKITDTDGKYHYSKIVAVAAPGVQFSVYPNPAKDKLFITIPQSAGQQRLTIADIKGAILKTMKVPAGVATTSISLSDLQAGIYTVILYSNNSYQSLRIVKQ